MKRSNRFNRGTPTYQCIVCGRLTRETGEGESDLRLCAFDFLKSGFENLLADGLISREEFNTKVADLKTRFNRKDGQQ